VRGTWKTVFRNGIRRTSWSEKRRPWTSFQRKSDWRGPGLISARCWSEHGILGENMVRKEKNSGSGAIGTQCTPPSQAEGQGSRERVSFPGILGGGGALPRVGSENTCSEGKHVRTRRLGSAPVGATVIIPFNRRCRISFGHVSSWKLPCCVFVGYAPSESCLRTTRPSCGLVTSCSHRCPTSRLRLWRFDSWKRWWLRCVYWVNMGNCGYRTAG